MEHTGSVFSSSLFICLHFLSLERLAHPDPHRCGSATQQLCACTELPTPQTQTHTHERTQIRTTALQPRTVCCFAHMHWEYSYLSQAVSLYRVNWYMIVSLAKKTKQAEAHRDTHQAES